jgi:methionyl-tRNA formyltransferase
MRASPVKQLAIASDIPVVQPQSLRDEQAIRQFRDYQVDLMIVVAYGLILPAELLAIPVHGCLNVHASLLPRWRGAAPIQRAILAADSETGITIMQMAEGLDTGDMLRRRSVPVAADMTAGMLHDELAQLGASLLLEVVNDIDKGNTPEPVAQDDSLATYAEKLVKSEAEIDWSISAEQVLRVIKAFNPWPVAYTHWAGRSLRVWDARLAQQEISAQPGEVVVIDQGVLVIACGSGALELLEVQPEGKKRMPVAAYMNARKDEIVNGVVFG